MAQKRPYVLPAAGPSSSKPATFIFLHGYGDDAEGLPLGLCHFSVPVCTTFRIALIDLTGIAQQFQMYSKLPQMKWVLPNAPHNHDAMAQAWYVPKALSNATKPRLSGREEEENGDDDEEGIMKSVRYIDQFIEDEIHNGVEPGRIVVGGFSMGCAVAMVWGLVSESRWREKIGGVVGLSGYLPLAERLEGMRKTAEGKDAEKEKKWFIVHGTKDILVPLRLFENTKKILSTLLDPACIETHTYENMGHSTCTAELRDLLMWLESVATG
jgi:predicted esterase